MATVLQARVLAEEPSGDFRRIIRGCVIYDEDSYVDALLAKEALEAARQIAGVIVRGDNDVNAGHSQCPRLKLQVAGSW